MNHNVEEGRVQNQNESRRRSSENHLPRCSFLAALYSPGLNITARCTLNVNVVELAVMTHVAEEGNRRKGGMTVAEITQSVIGKIMMFGLTYFSLLDPRSRSCGCGRVNRAGFCGYAVGALEVQKKSTVAHCGRPRGSNNSRLG